MNSLAANPAQSLDDECRTARQLVDILEREQAQLVNADINGLTELVDGKASLVGQMSALATQRHQRLASAGYPSNENGMKDWLKSASVPETARRSWKELLKLARSIKETNRINGVLIAKHMSRNQGALNALNINRNGGSFYGPDGQSMSRPSSRNLVIG